MSAKSFAATINMEITIQYKLKDSLSLFLLPIIMITVIINAIVTILSLYLYLDLYSQLPTVVPN